MAEIVGSGLTDSRADAAAGRAGIWRDGWIASLAWLAAAAITIGLPDVIPWGSRDLFAGLLLGGAALFALLTAATWRRGGPGERLRHAGPWFIALGVWLALWELSTAKLGWLPKPFFSPPQGLLHVYVTDWQRLGICVLYTLRLWSIGFAAGVAVGFVIGVGLGWSKRFAYWGMPVLKLIGPVPASAWIPCTFFFPTTFHASLFLVGLASGIPVIILTAAGVQQVSRAFYDVARTLGATERFLVLKVAIPAALPNVFVGLFMGLYASFAVLVVAEMLGAKYGLGWYLQFQTAYSAYVNVYAALIIIALLCAGLVKLLFMVRDHVLDWQKGIL
ncbi:MAG TPA: ABC transporter permease subunit [Kaistia sp.]|nr:ABC transporter permease subunit [Kaistia sp.]